MTLHKKVVLVTGASSGIGKETARQLLKDGHIVYVAARRIEKMNSLTALGAQAIKMDITKEEEVVAAVKTIEETHGGVDILVNNAGYASYGSMEDTKLDDARYQFEVNLFGLAHLTQLVLPYMRAQKAGKIINVSSVGGKIYSLLGSWYHATKHALEGWSDSLRLELAPFNIDVVIVEPGLIKTEFGDVMLGPMLERSAESAYKAQAAKVAKATTAFYEGERGSNPKVIADVIQKAIHSKKPKTRYVAGSLAKPIIFMRWLLSDRMFDWVSLKLA